MQRAQMTALRAWKDSAARKPLLLQGVRQCGKTWLLKEFGRTAFSSMVNVNFDENPEYAQFFEVKDVKRIIQNLALVTGKPIIPGQTLLVLDEIQDSPAALNALKYFREHMPNLHVAAAGSLLGVALAGKGFPVGQVDFMKLHPLSFTEFLQANGDDRLVAYLAQIDDLAAIPDAFLHPLEEQLRAYFITGGLPEPVGIWAERRDMAGVEAALSAILRAYELDFAKHAKATDFPKISLIWRSLPTQLGRENQGCDD